MNRYFSKEDMRMANKPIEKILNIIIHQANQTLNEIPLPTHWNS